MSFVLGAELHASVKQSSIIKAKPLLALIPAPNIEANPNQTSQGK
jgi:hypothetical protein